MEVSKLRNAIEVFCFIKFDIPSLPFEQILITANYKQCIDAGEIR